MDIVPKEKWGQFCHMLVYHGRAVCKAIKPRCEKCEINELCDFGKTEVSR
jgi:endonuclease-3